MRARDPRALVGAVPAGAVHIDAGEDLAGGGEQDHAGLERVELEDVDEPGQGRAWLRGGQRVAGEVVRLEQGDDRVERATEGIDGEVVVHGHHGTTSTGPVNAPAGFCASRLSPPSTAARTR